MQKRISIFLLLALAVWTAGAQRPRRRTTTATKQRTTQTNSRRKQNTQPARKKTATPLPAKSKEQLRKEAAAAVAARKLSQQQAAQLNKSIRSTLDSVLILDHQIGRQQKSIDSITTHINSLRQRIQTLQDELEKLQKELAEKKRRYAKAMVYMQRNKNVQKKLMFIFSARNLEQMLRRMRYLREYSTFQRAQGQIIKEKQVEVHRKQSELLDAKTQLETSRMAIEAKRKQLQTSRQSCRQQVSFLNRNLSTVQKQIKEYQRKEADINAQIDAIIRHEIEQARIKAEAERKRREEARKRAAAEAERKRLAAAKAARERAEAAKRAAEEAQRKAKEESERQAAKERLKQAEATLKTAKTEEKTATKELEKAEKRNAKTAGESNSEAVAWKAADEAEARLSGNFAANRGRLPMPITGSYSVVGHYGRYTVSGLSQVTLENKGINIRGQQGAMARAVYDGVVSGIYIIGGQYVILIRHGSYISVYSGLSGASVSKGQQVSTRQTIGAVGRNDDGNYVLQFQLRQGSASLNPESWVR